MIEASDETTTRFPWPPQAGRSALASLFETWKRSTFSPGELFRELPSDGLGPAVLYLLIVGVVAAFFEAIWGTLAGIARSSLLAMIGAPTDAAESLFGVWSPVIAFFFSPIFLLLQLFFLAGVFHVALLIVGGANRDFRTTIRVLCYAYSPRLFVVFPLLGGLVGSIWAIVVAVIGLKEAHGTDPWRAVLAVFLPVALLVGAAIFLGIALALVVGFASLV